MTFDEWVAEANSLLHCLSHIDVGYPLGENVVRPPQEPSSVDFKLAQMGLQHIRELHDFYLACDGVSWPDIHNGYFLKSLDSFGEKCDRFEVVAIRGPLGGPVAIIGSTGSGALFAIREHEGDVLLVPNGRVEEGTYNDRDCRVRTLANDYAAFVFRLLNDLQAFVDGDADHRFTC